MNINYLIPTAQRRFEVIGENGNIYYFGGLTTLKDAQNMIYKLNDEKIDLIATLQNVHDVNVVNYFDIELKYDVNIYNMPFKKLLDNTNFYNYLKANKNGYYVENRNGKMPKF